MPLKALPMSPVAVPPAAQPGRRSGTAVAVAAVAVAVAAAAAMEAVEAAMEAVEVAANTVVALARCSP